MFITIKNNTAYCLHCCLNGEYFWIPSFKQDRFKMKSFSSEEEGIALTDGLRWEEGKVEAAWFYSKSKRSDKKVKSFNQEL